MIPVTSRVLRWSLLCVLMLRVLRSMITATMLKSLSCMLISVAHDTYHDITLIGRLCGGNSHSSQPRSIRIRLGTSPTRGSCHTPSWWTFDPRVAQIHRGWPASHHWHHPWGGKSHTLTCSHTCLFTWHRVCACILHPTKTQYSILHSKCSSVCVCLKYCDLT